MFNGLGEELKPPPNLFTYLKENVMTILNRKLVYDLHALKQFDLTDEELEGYIDFYLDTYIQEETQQNTTPKQKSKKTIWIFGSKNRERMKRL